MKIDNDFIALKKILKLFKRLMPFLAMNEAYEVYGYDEVADVLAMGEG